MGLRLTMAVFEVFQCVEPLRMTKVQTFLLKFDESWVTLWDQCKNHDFEVLNQSIRVQGARIIRLPYIRTSYLMHGSSQPLVFREHFAQINCSQSVKMKIRCCKKICQIYTTRDFCSYKCRRYTWKICGRQHLAELGWPDFTMFNRRPTGSPFLTIFRSDLF